MSKRLKPVRVLIVDDSPFLRASLKKILGRDPEIEVVDVARDGLEAIKKLQTLKPDVITMDIEMPVMNGIQALEEIMRWSPIPVIVLSAVTTDGAKLTIKALELGAVEVVAKPSGKVGDDLVALADDILFKVKNVAGIELNRNRPALGKIEASALPASPAAGGKIPVGRLVPGQSTNFVGIAASTGGPLALQTVLAILPRDFPVPVAVVQHMPPGFTSSLAVRLNSLCKISVKEAEDGEVLRAGTVYIGQSGKQFQIRKNGNQLIARITSESPIQTLYKPSADVMFMSLARELGAGVLGVVLTGMGNDGLAGMRELKAKGAFALAESERTCIVYGMPRAIVEAGLSDRIEPLQDIGGAIIECVNRR